MDDPCSATGFGFENTARCLRMLTPELHAGPKGSSTDPLRAALPPPFRELLAAAPKAH